MFVKLGVAVVFLLIQVLIGCGRSPESVQDQSNQTKWTPRQTPPTHANPLDSGDEGKGEEGGHGGVFKAGASELEVSSFRFTTDFTLGETDGWRADHAYYTEWMEPEIAFEGGLRPLPLLSTGGGTAVVRTAGGGTLQTTSSPSQASESQASESQAFELRGANVPVTLFMYAVREVGPAEGIVPHATYDVQFDVMILSAASRECEGFGGSPGDMSLFVGATGAAPAKSRNAEEFWTLEPGPLEESSAAFKRIGEIDNGKSCDPSLETFARVARKSRNPVRARADAEGRLHLIVGTSGGYMGETRIFIERISARLARVD